MISNSAKATVERVVPSGAEAWAPVHGYEGIYEVSSYGRVRRVGMILDRWGKLRNPRDLFLRHTVGPYGYPYVNLYVGNKISKKVYVHTAVARAFFGERPDGYEVAHLDGERDNPCLDNLAYVSRSENEAHKLVHGTRLRGEDIWASKLSAEKVVAMRKMRQETGVKYSSLGKMFSISEASARDACVGATWAHLDNHAPLVRSLKASDRGGRGRRQ